MNKNATALILIILAIGIYFTFTSNKLDELKEIRAVNSEYQQAINNAERLVKVRDSVLAAYNNISETDKDRLNKLVPDNVDNVRLIIDVKDDIAAAHGLSLKNIKTSSPDMQQQQPTGTNTEAGNTSKYGMVTLSFSVTTSYQIFMDFLKDLEASLRIMDISKLTVAINETGGYDFGVEVKTYWLKQ